MPIPSDHREAGWRDVLDQVSVADVGAQVKPLIVGLIAWAVWLCISAGVEAGASAIGLGVHIPTVVWIIAIGVFMFVATFTGERSYHEWTLRLFFPKLGFIGWLTATAYITLIIEAFRLTRTLDSFPATIAAFGIYLVLIGPGILLVGLLELGHHRLMEKRANP